MAIATGQSSAPATLSATLWSVSPATAPATSVRGVDRGADDASAPRPGTGCRLKSRVRARCMLAAHAGLTHRRTLPHSAGVGALVWPAPLATPGTPFGYPSEGISDG